MQRCGGHGAMGCRAVIGVLFVVIKAVRAEIFAFNDLQGVGNFSAMVLHTFYLYSHKDAPDKSLGDAFVKFHDIRMEAKHPDSDVAKQVKDYKSMQLVLLPLRVFWDGLRLQQSDHQFSGRFCCRLEDEKNGKCKVGQFYIAANVNGLAHDTYPFLIGQPQDLSLVVHQSGPHLLLLVNCGPLNGALSHVSGTVLVRNPFGFLSARDYQKLPFYGWLIIAYLVAGACWLYLLVKWRNELTTLHLCIAIAVLLGIIESFLWWFTYHEMNVSGATYRMLSFIGFVASVAKSLYTWTLVLVASFGWGVTKAALNKKQTGRIIMAASCYIAASAFREVGINLNRRPFPGSSLASQPSQRTIILLIIPIALWHGSMSVWILTSVQKLTATLKQRKQTEKLALFQYLFVILASVLFAAALSMVTQVVSRVRNPQEAWRNKWFYEDGVSHSLFLVVLAAVMWLWAPHKHSKLYAHGYRQTGGKEVVSKDDEELRPAGPSDWTELEMAEVDDDADDDGEDESFWANTHGVSALTEDAVESSTSPEPTTLGAPGPKPEIKQKASKAEKVHQTHGGV